MIGALGRIVPRLRALLNRRAADDALQDEIRLHIEMETEKNRRAGMAPAEARRVALAHFGGVQRVREEHRDVRRLPWLEDAVALRQALRTLRRSPGFTTFVVVSLGVAIALNTTMYGVLDALVHPRVDMRAPERLYWVRMYGDYHWNVDNHARDAAVESTSRSYEGIARYEPNFGRDDYIEAGNNTQAAGVAGVSANYFDLLGVRTLAGRTFIPSDITAEATPAVIGEQLAAGLFRSTRAALGRTIQADGKPYVVVGVISQTSDFPGSQVGVWTLSPFVNRGMYVRLIRLRDGVTRAQMEQELDQVAHRIALAAGEDPRSVAFRVQPAADPQFHYHGFHIALIAAVLAVLLVACANIANLQLARGLARGRELALRAALGASRKRLVAHLVTESGILALAGLALGLLLTWWGKALLVSSIPKSVGDYIVTPQLSWRVFVFAAVAAVACTLLVGLGPAVRVSRADPNDLLKSGAGTGATRRMRRQFGWLVMVEIGLSLALLSAAAVMVHMSIFAGQMWFGFDPAPLASGYIVAHLPDSSAASYPALLQSATERLRTANGVEEATVWGHRSVVGNAISVSDAGGVREIPAPLYGYTVVTPSYVRAFGLRIVQGRDFMPGERDERAVIVDRSTARRLWPNANPVGSLVKFGDAKADLPWVQVVGVVAPADDPRTRQTFGRPLLRPPALGTMLYLPSMDDSVRAPRRESGSRLTLNFVTRSRGDVNASVLDIRRAGLRWPLFSVATVASMEESLGLTRTRTSTRFVSRVFMLFAALALGLAALGVYGVVAYSVAERRRELGVRIALGASRRDILHAVLRETIVLGLGGIAVGLLLTKYGVPLLRAFALESDFYNAPLFAALALGLLAIAGLSAFVPALRATRVDATESLRAE